MPASARLVCISPANIHEFWPIARPLIKKAMERGDLADFRCVERDVCRGQSQLWLALDGDRVIAAAVTDLSFCNAKKVCMIVACGGFFLPRFSHFIKDLEQFARDEGCSRMRMMGRRGWAKVFPDYYSDKIVLEKVL